MEITYTMRGKNGYKSSYTFYTGCGNNTDLPVQGSFIILQPSFILKLEIFQWKPTDHRGFLLATCYNKSREVCLVTRIPALSHMLTMYSYSTAWVPQDDGHLVSIASELLFKKYCRNTNYMYGSNNCLFIFLLVVLVTSDQRIILPMQNK